MLSERVKAIRKELKLTQTEFGERIGVGIDVIKNIEYNRSTPNEKLIAHMCDIYRINPHWLETGNGDMFLPDAPQADAQRVADTVAASPAMQSLFAAYDQLDDRGRAVFEEYVCNFVADYHRRQGERNEARNAEPFSQPDPFPEEESM